ncbi:hypothetical protein SPWS13_4401 [Shewanella putrefaciens]|nr:hypothetical protein SPWS13_4401 [Shewanella putrefaciens]
MIQYANKGRIAALSLQGRLVLLTADFNLQAIEYFYFFKIEHLLSQREYYC